MSSILSLIIYYPIFFFRALNRRLSKFIWQHYCIYYCQKKGVRLGEGTKFNGYSFLRFEKGSAVTIGNHFICNSGIGKSIDNTVCSKIVVCENASLTIGHDSGFSNISIFCYSKITIGDHVNIGAGTMIFDTDFHSLNASMRTDRKEDIKNAKVSPIHIGDLVFIGTGCIIGKGVSIGNKSIVAAGSVVTKDIPAGEIWGGNPARFIKKADL